jgi:hypothetical protein
VWQKGCEFPFLWKKAGWWYYLSFHEQEEALNRRINFQGEYMKDSQTYRVQHDRLLRKAQSNILTGFKEEKMFVTLPNVTHVKKLEFPHPQLVRM